MNQNNDTLHQILDKADILAIVGQYVTLEKSGKNYFGICPFHDDTNPSMSVSPDKKIFKCFSCGAGGNTVQFVSRIENIPFAKAMQKVGESVGIQVDLHMDKDYAQKAKYYDIMDQATNFYQFFLQNTEQGKQANQYLAARGITSEVIEHFEIGLSPKENNLLFLALEKAGVLPLDMIELGLVKRDKDYYDVFKDRIIFPIADLNGNKVGFSGRIYDKQTSSHKYVNSPETLIFKKSQTLYNYHRAANEIKKLDMVFVFEGFMDVIAAYRANVINAIATMGTALTQEHVQAIRKLTKRVVLCFDGDQAGIEASKRASQILLSSGVEVKIVLFPDGMDPDDFLKTQSGEQLYEFLHKEQISSLEFFYRIEKLQLNLNDPQSIEHFKRTIFTELSYYKSNVLNEIYIQKIAQDLGISQESLKDDLARSVPRERYIPPLEEQELIQKIDTEVIVEKYAQAEKLLVISSMENKDNCMRIFRELDYHTVQVKYYQLLASLYEYYQTNQSIDVDLLKRNLNKDQIELVDELLRETQYDISFIELETDKLIHLVKQYPNEKIFQANRKKILNKRGVEPITLSDVNLYRELLRKRKKIVNKKNE